MALDRKRPEDFLELVERAKRGRLKVYIGPAAGVGKTYQMLEEAHALKKRGVDVVLAFIETHGRAETEALVEGLEVIPRRRMDYRGVTVEEMDLEAVLKRDLRLRAGKIYSQEKVNWALEHFFKPEKLSMLREIALREVAESIDRTVSAQARSDENSHRAVASERVMVCIASRTPHSAMLLRRASRLAGRLNTDWYVVYVETPKENPLRIDAEAQRHLIETEQKARELGAEVVRLSAKDPVPALLEFARTHGVGHIVIDRTRKSWWRQLLGQSVMARLVREAAGFDLHIVSFEGEEESA